MNFNINSKELEKLLAKAILVIPSKSTIESLNYLKLTLEENKLTITASDNNVYLSVSSPVTFSGNAEFLVPVLLYNTVKSLNDCLININISENKLVLKTDNGKYNIGILGLDEYHTMPQVSGSNSFVMKGEDLKKAIDYTSFATGKESVRPSMTGVLFEFVEDGINFVATDTHKLVKYRNKKVKTDINEQFVVPNKSLVVLSKLLDDKEIKIEVSKTLIKFELDDVIFIARLISEKFPNYNNVIPVVNDKLLKINSKHLLPIVKQMLLYSLTNEIKQMKLQLKENLVEVFSEDIEYGASANVTIPGEYENENLTITFRTDNLLDILTHIDTDEICFKIHSPIKAVIIEPVVQKEEEELLHLLMPIRSNS